MGYDKTNWDENTPINVPNLQNIEDGIENNSVKISDVEDDLDAHIDMQQFVVSTITEPWDKTSTTFVNLGFEPKMVRIQAVIRNTEYSSDGTFTELGIEARNNCVYKIGNNYDAIQGRTVYFYDNSDNLVEGDVSIEPNGISINWNKIGNISGQGDRRLIITAFRHAG